jgi:hypothetical protein
MAVAGASGEARIASSASRAPATRAESSCPVAVTVKTFSSVCSTRTPRFCRTPAASDGRAWRDGERSCGSTPISRRRRAGATSSGSRRRGARCWFPRRRAASDDASGTGLIGSTDSRYCCSTRPSFLRMNRATDSKPRRYLAEQRKGGAGAGAGGTNRIAGPPGSAIRGPRASAFAAMAWVGASLDGCLRGASGRRASPRSDATRTSHRERRPSRPGSTERIGSELRAPPARPEEALRRIDARQAPMPRSDPRARVGVTSAGRS